VSSAGLEFKQVQALDAKIAEMQEMQRTLTTLAERCVGDDRPDCPILDDLSDEAGGQSRHAHPH
jgi:hypothetical protein